MLLVIYFLGLFFATGVAQHLQDRSTTWSNQRWLVFVLLWPLSLAMQCGHSISHLVYSR